MSADNGRMRMFPFFARRRIRLIEEARERGYAWCAARIDPWPGDSRTAVAFDDGACEAIRDYYKLERALKARQT